MVEPVEVAEALPARSALPGPGRRSYRGAANAVIAAMVSGAALVTSWTVALAIAAPGPVQLAPLTAHVSGMLAGYAVVLLVVLMSRWPVLDRGVGSDRLAAGTPPAGGPC